MQIETNRFGRVEIDDAKIIDFEEGLPGLEEDKRYAVLQFDESYPIIWLQSVETEKVCLPVVDSFLVKPDYVFDMSDEDVKDLKLEGPEDLQVISVLVIPDNIEQMTMNLVAPIIINLRTNRAKQIILSGDEYNVRYPIFDEICALIKGGEPNVSSVEEGK